jgi:integrase
MKFTDKLIKSLKPKNVSYDLREGSGQGFAMRVMPSGHKTWTFIYYFEGKKKRMTLGAYPALGLSDARELHRNAISCLANGKNPAAEQQQNRREARLANTVNDLVEEYLEKWAKPRKRSAREDERILRKDVCPLIGKYKAKDVTRRDIIFILDKIIDRGSSIAANRTLAVVRRMFNFAIERSIIEFTPCYGIKAPTKENRRDRVLSDAEIKAFWQGLDNANMFELSKLALKLQLATGQRKAEIVSAEWQNFDLESEWWTIPAHKAKNNHPHRVPLSKFALEILQEIKKCSNGSIWLFPSAANGAHMIPTAIDHALRKNLDKIEGAKSFVPHDLRRTMATKISALGVSRMVVSKILNHIDRSITSVYDRHTYDSEKKDAMDIWGEHLKSIISI